MYSQTLGSFAQVPAKDKDRNRTDLICTICAAFFAFALFVLAFALMNKDNYYKTNYPTDSDGLPCSYGKNSRYPFVYFPDLTDPNTRICVSKCPASGDSTLTCSPTSTITSCIVPKIYGTQINFQRLGGYCAPVDTSGQQTLINSAGLNSKWNFLNNYDAIRISLLIALGIGIIWLALVYLIPRLMANAVVFLSIVILLVAGLIVLFDQSAGYSGLAFWRILIGICLILVAVLFALELCYYRRRIKVTCQFLVWSNRFASSKLVSTFYIPLFITFTIGLILLCFFQYLAFLTHSQTLPSQGDIYLGASINPLLLVLVVVQFIWGLQFLKDSFNFVISGLAVQWYTIRDQGCCITFGRELKYHFGSVVGGSFLNAFFNVIGFFLESLRCYPDGACGSCVPFCNKIFSCCAHFFDLVRTDSYSYINLTGIAYCNASRNCEHLLNQSPLFLGSQSVLYFYRIGAYVFTVGLTVLLGYAIQKSLTHNINIKSLIIVIILAYVVLTYFVDYHANIAQGLQVSYLLQQSLSRGEKLPNDIHSFKEEIRKLNKSQADGKFG